jgi:hypothetical protein
VSGGGRDGQLRRGARAGGGGGERACALLLLDRWEEMRGSRGGGRGEAGRR